MKRNVLISWAAHMFDEVITPLIRILSKDYGIVVTVVSYAVPSTLKNTLDTMVHNQLIRAYFFIPDYSEPSKQYLFLKSKTPELKAYNFDIWLTGGEMQVYERYIMECILPKKCVRVVLFHGLTYLFIFNSTFAKKLLGLEVCSEESSLISAKRARFFLQKVNQTGGFIKVIQLIPQQLFRRGRIFFVVWFKYFRDTYSRIILPYVLFRKTFKYGVYDKLTQLGSGRSDVILFCDPKEARAHDVLFKGPKIYAVAHPSYGSCQCYNKKLNGRLILSPLSGIIGVDEVPKELLEKYLRDFKIVISEANIDKLHLRMHPRETGHWPFQLRDYLTQQGIDSEVVDATKPIREIMCDYVGMAGFASCSLRDARASCDMAFIVGFVSVSKYRYRDPKFVFGEGEGIGWIEEDGRYDPNIFVRQKYVPPRRADVVSVLSSLQTSPC